MKLEALTVNRSGTFDREILGFHCKDESDIAIVECRISAERNRVGRTILFAVGAAKQFALSGNMQSHVALHLNRADDKDACRHKYGPTLILVARINGRLHRRGIERDT